MKTFTATVALSLGLVQGQQLRGLQGNGNGNGNGNGGSGSTVEAGDLGLRFNKVQFINGNVDTTPILPMTDESFPLSKATYDVLSEQTNGVSIIGPQDWEVEYNLKQFIDNLGGSPTHPNSDPDHPYWAEFEEVVDFQLQRRAALDGDVALLLPEYPEIWSGFTLTDGAEAVHDEYPGYWQGLFIERLAQQGLKIDSDIIPQRSQAQFLHGIVMLADLNTWAIRAVGPNSFGSKWHEGRLRPEEMAWKISNGEVGTADGVPERIVEKIESMNLEKAEEFSAYPEGCPRHPSWPAMHSAASSASFWLSIVLDLTPEQLKEAQRVDNAVAQARTIAGVHYASDNYFGLNLGQQVIADQLADYLSATYGSNKALVQAKIENNRFTWPIDLS